MFDSGIKTSDLISLLKSEVDVAYQVPDESYIAWLNSLEQLLYSEIIKEYGVAVQPVNPSTSVAEIVLSGLTVPPDENPVRFEDIHAVYANSSVSDVYNGIGIELTKVTPASGRVFNNVYFKLGVNAYCKLAADIENVVIVYFVRPKTKTLTAVFKADESTNVKLPLEFIDIAKTRLRAEAYKLMNEDQIAAKWLSDYNALLETFKEWVTQRVSKFGV